MIVQLDTNVLTRVAQPTHPLNGTALSAIRNIEAVGHTCCIVPQNLFEFWAVATRPTTSNGLGLSVDDAKLELDQIQKAFALFRDPGDLVDEWQRLIVTHACQGKPSHDARIVAAMNLQAVTRLLTFNAADFTRYSHLVLLDPVTVAANPGIKIP